MNTVSKYILISLWLILFPVLFSVMWVRIPSLWFINLPESAWNFLAATFGVSCCEGTANLEIFVGLAIGFVLALCVLLLVLLFRRWRVKSAVRF